MPYGTHCKTPPTNLGFQVSKSTPDLECLGQGSNGRPFGHFPRGGPLVPKHCIRSNQVADQHYICNIWVTSQLRWVLTQVDKFYACKNSRAFLLRLGNFCIRSSNQEIPWSDLTMAQWKPSFFKLESRGSQAEHILAIRSERKDTPLPWDHLENLKKLGFQRQVVIPVMV